MLNWAKPFLSEIFLKVKKFEIKITKASCYTKRFVWATKFFDSATWGLSFGENRGDKSIFRKNLAMRIQKFHFFSQKSYFWTFSEKVPKEVIRNMFLNFHPIQKISFEIIFASIFWICC